MNLKANLTDSMENRFVSGADVSIYQIVSSRGDIVDLSDIETRFTQSGDDYTHAIDLSLLDLNKTTYAMTVIAEINNTRLFDTTTFNII